MNTSRGIAEGRSAPSIVIVDDSTANLKIYSRLAAAAERDVRVQPFNDPGQALHWLAANIPDLVISDYKMPGMQGGEFTRRLRRLPNCADVPVVIITVHDDRNFRIEALEAGATDFLRSPVDYSEFQTRTRNLLRLGLQQRLMRAHAVALEQELQESQRSRDQMLRESREWLAQIIDTVPAMISATNAQGQRIFMNAYHASVLELAGREAPANEVAERLNREVLSSGRPLPPFEETLIGRNGEPLTFVTAKSPLRDADGRTLAVLTTAVDITERKRAEALLEHQAHHDHLTALPNRAYLSQCLRRELDRCHAAEPAFALHFIDLDRFKYVNDGLGHCFGDRVLCEVGQRLRTTVRERDMVARIGGDEFAILQTGLRADSDAAQLAERINRELMAPIVIDGREVAISASIGIAVGPRDGQSPDELIRNADLAMYQVKTARGNTFRFFEAEMLAQARETARLRGLLRRALENGEFVLHYQPQIELRRQTVAGVEALIRWPLGERLMTPASFLQAADEAGLMPRIDRWVLRQACGQAKIWLAEGRPAVRIWVNVSHLPFGGSGLFEMVMRELDEAGVPPDLLGIELTEEIVPQPTHAAARALEQLRRQGVLIAIDDFGTGYSSLARLANLRVDRLKIDGSFVTALDEPSNRAIVRAVVGLRRALNVEVLAEGVETADQLDQIRRIGCELVQGYHTGRPMDANRLAALLTRSAGLRDAASAAPAAEPLR